MSILSSERTGVKMSRAVLRAKVSDTNNPCATKRVPEVAKGASTANDVILRVLGGYHCARTSALTNKNNERNTHAQPEERRPDSP